MAEQNLDKIPQNHRSICFKDDGGGGGISKTDSRIIHEKKSWLEFSRKVQVFQAFCFEILLQGKGFWRKDPEGGSKDQKIQMKFYGKNFETEKTQMWAMVHINNGYLLMSVSRFLYFWLLFSLNSFFWKCEI